jgi:hypothetical protein
MTNASIKLAKAATKVRKAKDKAAKVSDLQVFTAALNESTAHADVLDLVKRMGVKAARNAYMAGFYVARLRRENDAMFPANEPDVVALMRGVSHVGLKVKGIKRPELTLAQGKAKTAAGTAYSRLTADLGVRADKRGAKRGPRLTGNVKPDAGKADAGKADAGKADAGKADAPTPRTFAEVCDAMLAMVRGLAALNKKHAKVAGMIAIAATISKTTHDQETTIMAARKAK